MQNYPISARAWFLSVLFTMGSILPGCNPSAKDIMQKAFAEEPLVQVEYQPDGSRLYKTRNIVLLADYGRSQLSSLVMLVALSGDPTREDSLGGIGGVIKFRSIDNVPHYEVNRNLVLHVQGEHHDLGPCAYQQDTLRKGGKVEDLTVIVPQELVSTMAAVDTVQGTLGEVPFELTGEQLVPIRALVDTVHTR